MSALAFGSTGASAVEAVEIVNEETATHCGSTNETGCVVHGSGTVTLRLDLGVFGEAYEATCALEVDLRLTEAGGGVRTGAEIGPGDSTCTNDSSSVMTLCGESSGSGEEGQVVGTTESASSLCLNPSESSTDCVGSLGFDIVELANEQYETSFSSAHVGICELDAKVAMEDEEKTSDVSIHINHP